MSDFFWLTDEQVAKLSRFLPKSHGKPRVDDRRVPSGIILINRNGLRRRDAPEAYGPHKSLSLGDRSRRNRHLLVMNPDPRTTPKALRSEMICEVSGAPLPDNPRKYGHSSVEARRRWFQED